MKYYSKKQWTQKLTVMVLLAMALGGTAVQAMPSGADIRSGQGSISQDGKNMTVLQNSQRMAIDWTKFDIAKDETVRYAQPARNAISLNRVTGGQQSVIAGNLNANGNVVLVNPNGVVFTKNSSVDVGGLVASTARLNDEAMKNFGNGKDSLGLSLDKDSTASVINEGQIKAQGGLVALHAANVENKGTITNEGGTIAMAAAKNLTLSAADDDKLNFTVDGELAKAQALNSGSLKADGGYVIMTAKSAGDVLSTVVNHTGTIEAKTLRKNEKGQILLDGGDKGQVEVSGTLDASGTEAGQDAGNIKVIGEKTIVHDDTNLLAKGDNNGGKIETSGDVLDLGDNLNINASGEKGSHGTWLLDPLEVVISASKPSSADHEYGTIVGDTTGKTKNNIIFNDPPSGQNANNAYNSTTWIDSGKVSEILAGGTDVIIQAISSSGAASITLDSPIDITVSSSASKNPTFTLEANRNITINKNITAKSGGKGLNVMLNADTDGDGIGAVIMNADVTTNGGWFKSATGGSVTHKYGTSDADKKNYGTYNGVTVGGGPNHDGSSVGTYFGGKDTATKADNRFIQTSGGAITLNGEVAIGLNGGTLTLDTGGGDLTVTGLINSGNSYKAYIYGTDDWNNNKMIQDMVDQYLNDGTVPAYHYIGITYERDKDGNLIKDGNGYNWSTKKGTYEDGANNIHYVLNALTDTTSASGKSGTELSAINPQWYTSTKAGEGYDSFIIDKASTITVDEYLAYVKKSAPQNWKTKYNALTLDAIKNDPTKMATLKSDIGELIAHNWFLAEQIAENGTNGGSNVGDSYLATITTRLENSLSTPNGQHTLWVGGRGSGVRGRTVTDDKNNPATWGPSDPTLMDGFYWVTGPEGASSTYTDSEGHTLKYDAGTKFWDTASSDWKTGKNGEKVYGLEPTWSTYQSGGKTITQPDNNGPFLTVGYGSDNQWDDANFGGETTWGFVQETNLANSSLKINTGKGTVNLKGDIGKGQALDTLSIEGGTVQIGDKTNKVTDYNNGTVYVDHGLKITGTDNVKVGGEIHSGESPETDTSTSLDDQYKDNVTIQSGGNLEVHGITSHTYTVTNDDGTTTTTRGGKIKLTSTGTEGVITLGDGVDYNGKNTNGGVLKAASTANDSVVIDAQGSNGAFVNDTTSDEAIDTKGTWQVYSDSPEKNTFGTNLKSGTDALWTAKSDSNEIATKNKHEIDPLAYSTVSGNKFIFQATPDITLYSDDYLKTYGDEVTEETLNRLLKGKETFTGLDGETYDVTRYNAAFKEQSYEKYVDGIEKVTITSDGSAATATRTGGQYEATEKSGADGNKAVYDLKVNQNDAQPLAGYALATENGKLEIKKRTVTITSSGEQTYGNSEYTSWTDRKSGFANDDEKNFTYDHSIKSGSEYKTNLNKTTGRTTADVGTYDDSVSYSNLTISGKKNADGTDDTDFFNENYTLDTANSTGSIKVNKAELTLTLKDVSTTYGQGFDSTTYGYKKDAADLQGLTNGDAAAAITDVLQDSDFTYVNGGAKSDPNNENVKTQNAGSYQITGSTTKTLDNYNIKVVNPGTSTVNKAKLTFKVGNTETAYGSDAWTPYTYTLEGNANGDTVNGVKDNQISVTYTNGGVKSDASNANVKTQDVGSYALTGDFTLSGDTATNYEIDTANSKLTGTAKVTPAEIHLKLNDVSTTYGTAFDTSEYGYDASQLAMANGDDASVVTRAITNGDITYTNTGAETDADNIAKGIVTKDAGKYTLSGTTDKTLTNYKVVVDGADSVVNKAKLTVEAGSSKITYGDVGQYGQYDSTVSGAVNGNTNDDLKNQLQLQYSTDAYTDEGKKTNHVRYDDNGKITGYNLTVGSSVTNPQGSLKNYDVTYTPGTITVNKAEAEVTTAEKTTEYGTVDTNYQSNFTGAVNGDDANTLLNHLKLSYTTEAYTDKDGNGLYDHTADVIRNDDGTYGSYALDVANQAVLGDYDVTIHDSDVVLTPKDITVTNEMTQTYGDSTQHFAEISTPALVNGDSIDTDGFKIAVTEGDTPYQKNRNGRTTADAGEYDNSLSYSGGGIQHEDGSDAYNNYDVTIAGKIIVNPATLYIDTTGNSRTYGDVAGVIADLTQASQVRDLKTAAVNGDDPEQILKDLNIQDTSAALVNNQSRTNDVGSYDITTTYNTAETSPDSTLKNYAIVHKAGKETITKAPLTITTGDVTTDYGTVKETTSTVSGLTNGDTDTNLVYDYGNYGGGYLDDNTRTNNVGDYDFTTSVSGSDFLKNYDISGGDATLTIMPKDVYFYVDGKGSTFDDIIYTVTDPNHPGSRDAINSQLPYGETVTGGYGLGQALPDTPGSKNHYYTVDSTINGTPVYANNGQGTQVGNYVFHPTGQAVIHFDQPQKPDQTTHYDDGARRPQDKIESALPVFRVDAEGTVKQYGTYGIEQKTQTVVLSPTGMRMPEANQTSTQDRKYMTSLKTPDGQGTFRLEYNGVVLRVIPVDPAAEQVVEDGDKLKNVALSEQALYVAYTQMGLDLVNLKGVYIYMMPM